MVEEDVIEITSRYLRRDPEKIVEIYEALGIETLSDLAAVDPSTISDAFGVKDSTAKKIVADAREEASKGIMEAKTLADLLEEEKKRDVIPTGIQGFDERMGGGLPTGVIVGMYGPPGAGKSQFATQVAAHALKEGESVLYIDTENAFRPQRLLEIGGFKKDELKEVSDRFVLRRVIDAAALRQYFDEKEGEFISEAYELTPKVVVIDSISQPFRPYSARDKLPERSRMIAHILNTLLKYCTAYNALGMVTTHVQANPDAWGKRWQDVAPTVLKHIATYRFSIDYKGRTERVITLEDAPDKPPFEVEVELTDRGLVG
ncbi:ATPase domain-containing protein [Methanopyrus sp.]